jgi:MFS family permease
LLIFRFLAALGVGGEWAVGASLLSETWPKKWRPWLAAVLQTGVNVGILVAVLASILMAKAPPRYLFLVGILPALLVLWIRQAVPESQEWQAAKIKSSAQQPRLRDLFSPNVRRITIWVMIVCAVSLTAHWAFMFWHVQHLRNLPEVLSWTPEQKTRLVSKAMYLVIASSIAGNFFCGGLARWLGYRMAIAAVFLAYFFAMFGAYHVPHNHESLLRWFPVIGFCQGAFALFTMYLPPLFPTLLRTTGAGFCYNIGRVVAAFGTVFFGLFSTVGDHRAALLYASFLFVPAALVSTMMPRARD